MKIVKWWKKLREIVACHKMIMKIVGSYDNDHRFFINRIVSAENMIKDRTDVSADVHLTNHNPNQIIVVGRYRRSDYVKVFTLADNELGTLVDQLREMQRYGVVTKIDAPYEFRAVVEKDLNYFNRER